MARITDTINPVTERGEAYRASVITAHIQHVGWAEPGTLASVEEWKICALTYDATDAYIISVTWPNGSRSYVYEWDERSSYSYT
ncbi:hypothetical protein KAU11_07255 [Candidatus Babeliales bacterium]|nr:hypothetical protein [Candidatus Babeliales bacterium]